MKTCCPAAFDLMVYKDYKIDLKLVFPICRINLRIHHLTCSFINHRVTIHHNIFLKSLPRQLPHRIFHQLLIIHMLINGLLLSKFGQASHTGGGIRTKNNLLIPCDCVFDDFFNLFFCFHTVLTENIQLFCKF